jgi:hypothetical protein
MEGMDLQGGRLPIGERVGEAEEIWQGIDRCL